MTLQKTTLHIALLVASIAILFSSCNKTPSSAGGTSETSNGIAFVALIDDHTPAANAVVRLRSANYLTPIPTLSKRALLIGADAITDSLGRFMITDIEPGEYSMEITYEDSLSALLRCTVGMIDTMDLGREILKPFASISGKLDSLSSRAYIQIFGIERLIAVNADGSFFIQDLPAGMLNLRILSSDNQEVAMAEVNTVSGDTVPALVLTGWHYSKELEINTTDRGEMVTQSIFSFPLLVRLNSSNFNFLESQTSGQDIRFTKPDGTLLPYEIEMWNASSQVAVIWVKMDTVHGNSSQSFYMHWGNSSVTSNSNGAAVFDTTSGFRAVFHMNDTANLYDASANLGNGMNYGAKNQVGNIGGALEFTNNEPTYVVYPHKDNLDAANLLESPSGCTFSWWMRPYDDLDTISALIRRNIIAKGVDWGGANDQDWAIFVLLDTLLLEAHTPLEQNQSYKWTAAGSNRTSWDANTWYHITMTYDRTEVQWFVNGTPDGPAIPFDHDFDTSNDKPGIYIGRHHDSYPVENVFDGLLDEIRISNVKRSPEWIMLSYLNQKEDNSLIRFNR